MLHFEMGFQNLHEFAVQHLGLSDASAYRRITAMRVVREIPDVRAGLESGALCVANITAANTVFRAENKAGRPRSVEEKKKVFQQLEGLSKREGERKLLEIAPQALPRERERALTPELTELRVVVDAETLQLLRQLRNAHPQEDTPALLKRVLKESVARLQSSRQPKQPVVVHSKIKDAPTPIFAPVQKSAPQTSPPQLSLAEMRRQTLARAHYRCEYQSPDGRRCQSQQGLEIDHIQPRAQGGLDVASNLRVLCRGHNAYAAAKILGIKKMQNYLPSLR